MPKRDWVNSRTLVSPRPTSNGCTDAKWISMFGEEGKPKLGSDPLRYSNNTDGVGTISYTKGWGHIFDQDNKSIACTDRVLVNGKI